METEFCVIESGCLKSIETYLKQYGLQGYCVAVYDENTYQATADRHPQVDAEVILPAENLHANDLKYHPDIDGMTEAIRQGNLDGVCKRMENVLETVTVRKYPQISELKNLMCNMGALNALMSGSGPSVFGLFTDEKAAEDCATEIRKNGLASQVFVTNFCKPE